MFRKIVLSIISIFIIASASGQKRNQNAIRYINKYSKVAIASMNEFGIPASIKIAQGIFESGYGMSELATKSNNHFGIKCKSNWTGEKVYHDDDEAQECFRKYDSVYDSYADHSVFLSSSPRYASLFKLDKTDYKGWAYGLKKAGYATNPKYPTLLINIIELYDLNKLDRRKTSKEFIAGGAIVAGESDITEDNIVEKCEPSIKNPGMVAYYVMNGISVYRDNKELFIIARNNDTFETISKALKISKSKLLKYNNGLNLRGDRKMYLSKKRNKTK